MVSVNGSWTGLIGWRHKKMVRQSKSKLCTCGLFFYKLLHNPKQWHALQYDGGHFMEEDCQLSWKWKFVRKGSLEHTSVQFCQRFFSAWSWFHTSQALIWGLDIFCKRIVAHRCQMVFGVVISHLKSWNVGAFTWSPVGGSANKNKYIFIKMTTG